MGIQKTAIAITLLLCSGFAYSDTPLKCLAKNIYFESRNQPWIGMFAVGQVTMNRVKSTLYPNTICEVVKQKRNNICQFSWYCDGLSDNPTDKKAWHAASVMAVFVHSRQFPDVTEGSLWYHATSIEPPHWTGFLEQRIQIQDHIFYGPRRD